MKDWLFLRIRYALSYVYIYIYMHKVDKGFKNVPVNLNATDASVKKMEDCAIVGAIILDPVIINDVFIF